MCKAWRRDSADSRDFRDYHPAFPTQRLKEDIADVAAFPSYTSLEALLSCAERGRIRIAVVALPFPPAAEREFPEFRRFIAILADRVGAFVSWTCRDFSATGVSRTCT